MSFQHVGIDRHPLSDARYLLELDDEPDGLPELDPDEPLSPPPQSLAAHCGSVGFSVAHFEERPLGLLEDIELFDDLLPAVLASLLVLEPVDVPAPVMEPEPPSLLVVPVAPLVLLPDVPVLLVPVLLPLSEEPLEVPAVELFIEELLDGEELIELLLEGEVLVVLLLEGDVLLLP